MIGKEPTGVVAVFSTENDVERALGTLRKTGIPAASISIIGPGGTSEPPPELDHRVRHSAEVAGYWARWGAILGATVGSAVVAIPLLAAVVGLGPFAPVLLAVPVATSGVGAMASALVGLGVHEKHALDYEHALRAGKFVLVVHADDKSTIADARAALADGRPERVDAHGLRSIGAR